MTGQAPVTVNCPASMYHGLHGIDIGQEPESTARVRQVVLAGRDHPLLFLDNHLTPRSDS